MELVQQEIWMVVRVRRHGYDTNIECINAFITEEEAKERLRKYSGCFGEFKVLSTMTWFPPFH